MPSPDDPARKSRATAATGAALALLVVVFVAADLPRLGDYPLMTADQTGIAAPAWNLARTGVYGNPIYAGFFRTEELNYEYMPLYPLLVAGSFRLFGLGVVQARIVSVACGVAVLLLVFVLGSRTGGPLAGVLAAGSLCLLRLGVGGGGSGMPLVDNSRFIRYDILVPVFVVAAGIFAVSAGKTGRSPFLSGLCIGLATMAHVYGAFFLLPVALCLVAWHGRTAFVRPTAHFVAGFAVPLLPWAAYVLRDVQAYSGQMTRHSERVAASLAFFWGNLIRETGRWSWWWRGPDGRLDLLFRPGIWVLLASLALLAATIRRGTPRPEAETRGRELVLASLVTLPLCLGLFLSFKRHQYVLLVLPFLAVAVGLGLADLWRLSRGRAFPRAALVAVLAAAAAEGALGLLGGLRDARDAPSYERVCTAIAGLVPPHERVLCVHHYWFGLAGYDFRSLDLVKVLSESRYPHVRRRTFDEAVDLVDPGYVVVEEGMMESGRTPAYHVLNPSAARFWGELSSYLDRRCRRVGIVADRGYGRISVFLRIRTATGAPGRVPEL